MFENIKLEISMKTIVLTIVVLVLSFIVLRLLEIWVILFIAFIVSTALRPVVDTLERKGINRSLATVLLFALMFFLFLILSVTVFNEAFRQARVLSERLPQIAERVAEQLKISFPWLKDYIDLSEIKAQLYALPAQSSDFLLRGGLSGVFSFVNKAVSIIFEIVTVLVISAYMIMRKKNVDLELLAVVPDEKKEDFAAALTKVNLKLGAWIRGQLVLMVTVGVLTWFVLFLPSLFLADYHLDDIALPIAIMAALLEAVPNLGPLVTAVVTSFLAAGLGNAASVIYVIIVFTGIQQLENLFLVPQVMKKAVGIDPTLTIIAIIAGAELYGIIGAMLAVPLMLVLKIFLSSGFFTSSASES